MTTETARVYRYADRAEGRWKDFIQAMRSGQTFECDDEMYSYWLEVLPPVHMGYQATLPDGTTRKAHYGFAEGAEEVTAFWSEVTPEGNRYFGCRTNEINPYG